MAETVKHTPGPMTAFKSTSDFWNVVKGTGEFDPSVATVHPNYHDGVTAEECEANARLFAAAPEMLGALAELVTAIDRRWEGETERKRANGVSPRMEDALEAARAALAKARSGHMTRTEVNAHTAFLTRALQSIRAIKTGSEHANVRRGIEDDPKFENLPGFVRVEIRKALMEKATEIVRIARTAKPS